MPDKLEPERKFPPPTMPGPDEYDVVEVNGFAHLSPEQKLWPVVSLRPRPSTSSPAPPPPPTGPGTSPSPPG
ncbi:MAG TPA: hypothetical protein VH092_30320 [Urbifossiella sp.]|jgi:hypothetical protein|nr:hypothetical protein [Urbifossiella sp.]